MMRYAIGILLLVAVFAGLVLGLGEVGDIGSVGRDLAVPAMVAGEPEAGRRVRRVSAEYAGTDVYHTLYLPSDWERGKAHPVIVEYAGNGRYRNNFSDVCSGKAEDCNLGYGIGGGERFIWIVLPFISKDGKQNQLQWWGDVEATVAYCKGVVGRVCGEYGGDRSAVFLVGFSRGAIACNFIGLHDDEIASLWRGFFCHSHYDGVREWNYSGSDRESALKRLGRLKNRPQFISHEVSVDQTRRYLEEACPNGAFTFQAVPYRNHTDSWVLRDIPERMRLRRWFQDVLEDRGTTTTRR